MLRALLTGFPVLVLCVALQALFAGYGMRAYAHFRRDARHRRFWVQVLTLSAVMMLVLLGTMLQMSAWAVLFLMLGEFADFPTALYHSAVNFSTLGYGDVVMSEHWRLLGPLEASNGILMFGVSTAMMTAAVMDILKEAKRDAA